MVLERAYVGIVSGVVIPDSQEDEIFRNFDAFIATLPPKAFQNGEPKGRHLNEDELWALVQMISGFPIGILLCPTVLDLTSLAGRSEANVCAAVCGKLTQLQGHCKHVRLRQQIKELAAKIGAMSNQQMLRLAAWARCVGRCINDSIIFHCCPDFHADWSSLRFEIDPVQQTGGTEAEVFDFLLRAWLVAWSEENPLPLIREIHTPNHPFVKNWATAQGIDVGMMFDNNIHYVPSNRSKGIQLADMTATIIRRSMVGLAKPDNMVNYGFMMARTIGQSQNAAGLFSFAPQGMVDADSRYEGVGTAIVLGRKRATLSYAVP